MDAKHCVIGLSNDLYKLKIILISFTWWTFSKLFKEKHPEFMSSRIIKNDMDEYGWSGCYWDYKYKRPHRLFGSDYFGLFDCYPKSPKPQKRDKIFLDLIYIEMHRVKKRRRKCN